MVYLSGGRDEGEAGEEKLEGGGTHFPRLRHPSPSLAEGEGASQERREWCDFISCPASSSSSPSSASASDSNDGVTFLPVAGNAVFWQNFDTAGRGHKETLHAGLPVTKGQKIGLNIWSWYQAGHRAPEEGEDDADEGGGNAYGVGTNENDKEEL
jgi:prolyl 4-hydroxylase